MAPSPFQSPSPPLHLSVALDGAGWHSAAWRERGARPGELFSAGYWADLVAEAERGLLDFVTVEDSLSLQSTHPAAPDDRTDRVRGRLDAMLTASRVAPLTRHVGLVPVAVVTHTEPFHLSRAVATLDFVSEGRAGVQVRISHRTDEFGNFGRRTPPGHGEEAMAELYGEAGDYVEVLRRLWDSWEDDAEIRDTATGRYIDRDKLHYIRFESSRFSVLGPAITPRPPQGQPVVAVAAHDAHAAQLVGACADIGFVALSGTDTGADTDTDTDTGAGAGGVAASLARIRAAQAAAGRADDTVHVFGDLVVLLDDSPAAAARRRARLDERANGEAASALPVFAGTPSQLADLLLDRQRAGLTGFRLHPATLPHDLEQITRRLVPELQRRGAFRTAYPAAGTLRGLLGLPRPVNRYAER
ncbi:LLM class flavin-dependent oxidoreductase [Streptomyces sp. NPDC087658]|uniref:LLM class flavin-dependent oxidoreductase n=1 Tax=Streptomyces sp. NPDC087658 TaxID=3365800 RepID=UPI00380DBD65